MLKRNEASLTKVKHGDSSAFSSYPCNFTSQTGQ